MSRLFAVPVLYLIMPFLVLLSPISYSISLIFHNISRFSIFIVGRRADCSQHVSRIRIMGIELKFQKNLYYIK